MNPEFSIIMPTLDNCHDVHEIIPSINLQRLLPKEIVIADSSLSNDIQEGLDNIESSAPITNNINLSYLFPFRWVLVGLLGILLDLVKAPGYLLAGIMASFVRRSSK